jgi:hypothetical protein
VLSAEERLSATNSAYSYRVIMSLSHGERSPDLEPMWRTTVKTVSPDEVARISPPSGGIRRNRENEFPAAISARIACIQ